MRKIWYLDYFLYDLQSDMKIKQIKQISFNTLQCHEIQSKCHVIMGLYSGCQSIREKLTARLSCKQWRRYVLCARVYQLYFRGCQRLKQEWITFIFTLLASVIHLLLGWHFSSELIHWGSIDLPAAAELHLSIKLSCLVKCFFLKQNEDIKSQMSQQLSLYLQTNSWFMADLWSVKPST